MKAKEDCDSIFLLILKRMVEAAHHGTVFTNYCRHTLNSCILNMSHLSNFIAVKLCVDNEIVVLRAVNDFDMTDGDILLPKWAMQVLSFTDGDSCRYTIVVEDSVSIADECCVKLLFCFSKRMCQWDESAMSLLQLEANNGWQVTWPEIDIDSLTTLAPSLLSNVFLVEGAMVAMKAMDTLLVLTVHAAD